MELWFTNNAIPFVITVVVMQIAVALSNKFKPMYRLAQSAIPFAVVYIFTTIIASCFGVAQYVTIWRVFGIYILFFAIPFTLGVFEACFDD